MRRFFVGLWAVALASCTASAPEVTECGDLTRGCAAHGLEVRALSEPSPLVPFVLEVSAPGARQVSAAFEMRGMDMGPAFPYRLAKSGERWQARVVLPACVAGRRDWLLWLTVDDRRYGFAFEAGAGGSGGPASPSGSSAARTR